MRVLFLCSDNGARSQMAEGIARQMFAGEMTAVSAGVERGRLHPLAVETMREIDLDIADQQPKTLADIDDLEFDLVVVVCERDISTGLLPATCKRLHWPIMDPATPPASQEVLRRRFRDTRTAIHQHLKIMARTKPGQP